MDFQERRWITESLEHFRRQPLEIRQPATTPYAVADWWCRYILPPGGVLLDPFVGSGTMLAAALDNGASKVIGIDKEAKYLRMAAKRVREA